MTISIEKASLLLLVLVSLSCKAFFVETTQNDIIDKNLTWRMLSETGNGAINDEDDALVPPSVTFSETGPSPLTSYVNISQHSGNYCNRVCIAGDHRVCHFDFTLEHYQVAGVACGNCLAGNQADCNHPQCVLADGIERGFMSINRKLPGTAIHVCKNDLVVVDVHNKAQGTSATIHWHGIHMRRTPYMDGVPFLTQCPIPCSTTFRYSYQATEAGTQFYHSHSGLSKANGQYGALIVREPPSDINNADSYDHDLSGHYILISDWMHTYAEHSFPGLSTGSLPNSVLINGRGIYTNLETKARTVVPPTRYYVQPGKRYRFRVIDASSHVCAYEVQIENHEMLMIASDSFNFSPRPFTTLVINSGERYDFVLTANHTRGDFWIRVRGMGVCASRPIESFALLRYSNSYPPRDEDVNRPLPPMPAVGQVFTPGDVLNHPNANCVNPGVYHCITELSSIEEDDDLRFRKPDYKIFLGFKNIRVPNDEIFRPGTYNVFSNINGKVTVVGSINNLTYTSPSYPPLTQPDDVLQSDFCDSQIRPEHCDNNVACPCTHRISVREGAIVELIIVDEVGAAGAVNHPFHLHGYAFLVTGLGFNPSRVPLDVSLAKNLERRNLLPRNSDSNRPIYKDTVSIPSRGYAIVRLRADNPGYWFLHCHYDLHMVTGMALVMQVGRPYEMVEPPWDFPKCGNYKPKVKNWQ